MKLSDQSFTRLTTRQLLPRRSVPNLFRNLTTCQWLPVKAINPAALANAASVQARPVPAKPAQSLASVEVSVSACSHPLGNLGGVLAGAEVRKQGGKWGGRYFCLAAVGLLLSGCAGVDPERSGLDALGGVGAGAVGYEITKKPLIGAAAGAGGVLVADIAQQLAANGDKKGIADAYAKGQSDSIKELYWAKQRDKATLMASTATDQVKTTLYPISIPAGNQAGVNYTGSTVVLPVIESK